MVAALDDDSYAEASSMLTSICSGADMLTQGMSISGNQTLISANGTFALGFFSPGNTIFTFSSSPSFFFNSETRLLIRNMSDIYIRTNAWDGRTFAAGFLNNSRLAEYNTIDVNDAEMCITLSFSQHWALVRLWLSPTGDLSGFYWDENSKMLILLRDAARDECHYGRCGAFGICEWGSSPPSCNCLPGFRPHSQKDWDMRNWSGGCVQHKELTCDERNEFLRLERVKVPDYSVMFKI
ncbi:hypothetical protein Sjap_025440 [Stephania japonica]|uniref:EGF-like domain-containing protein n=1 Tax=Stephania japonica TaxID=461633 RepID=A0AAP0E9J7_9MAGN